MSLEQRKKSIWFISLMVNGKRRRWSTGTISKTRAKVMEGKLKADIAESRFLDKKKVCNLSFREIAQKYQEVGMPMKSMERYISILNAHLLPYFSSNTASEITPAMVELYRKKRLDENASTSTINLELNCMSAIFTHAMKKERLLEYNPLSEIKREKANNERDRVITEDEYVRILGRLVDNPRARNRSLAYVKPITIVAWNTAMRIGELLNLKWSNVDLRQRIITLEPEQTKGKQKRIIPMNEPVFKVFRELSELLYMGVEHVLTRNGKPLKSIDRAFQRAVKEAGIEDFRFHDIRHCAITRWRREGNDLLTIMKISGHKTMKVFKGYNSFDTDDLREVVTGKCHPNVTQSNSAFRVITQPYENQQSTYAGVVQR